MTRWYEACSYARRRRRRVKVCEQSSSVALATAKLVHPRVRCFVESPLDAAMVLLEERRAELSLSLLHV